MSPESTGERWRQRGGVCELMATTPRAISLMHVPRVYHVYATCVSHILCAMCVCYLCCAACVCRLHFAMCVRYLPLQIFPELRSEMRDPGHFQKAVAVAAVIMTSVYGIVCILGYAYMGSEAIENLIDGPCLRGLILFK